MLKKHSTEKVKNEKELDDNHKEHVPRESGPAHSLHVRHVQTVLQVLSGKGQTVSTTVHLNQMSVFYRWNE